MSSPLWYLQWTTIGPAKGGLTTLTFLRNLSMPMGEKGTPKSGQLVKCSWVTSLGVLAATLACYAVTQTQAEKHSERNLKHLQKAIWNTCPVVDFKQIKKEPSYTYSNIN